MAPHVLQAATHRTTPFVSGLQLPLVPTPREGASLSSPTSRRTLSPVAARQSVGFGTIPETENVTFSAPVHAYSRSQMPRGAVSFQSRSSGRGVYHRPTQILLRSSADVGHPPRKRVTAPPVILHGKPHTLLSSDARLTPDVTAVQGVSVLPVEQPRTQDHALVLCVPAQDAHAAVGSPTVVKMSIEAPAPHPVNQVSHALPTPSSQLLRSGVSGVGAGLNRGPPPHSTNGPLTWLSQAWSSLWTSGDIVEQLLHDRERLKKLVVESYRKVHSADGLALEDLRHFRDDFCAVNQVPAEAFGDLVNEHLCFDFDGSGRLSLNEVYKLVKFELIAYRKRLGLSETAVEVPFKSIRDSYREVRLLGHGSQGQVKLVVDSAQKEFCVKCMPKDQMSAEGMHDIVEEFQAMQFLACEKVAQVTELFQDDCFFYMVGEAYTGGDFTTLKERALGQGVPVTEQYYRGLFQQCLEGLAFMHGQAMMHCDIKEPNLMVKKPDFRSPEVVIIDFGVSQAMADRGSLPRGTPGYMPPETLDSGTWFPKGDTFSMGVCIIQMMLDKIPPQGARTNVTPGGIFVEGCTTLEDILLATRCREPPFHLMSPHQQHLVRLLQEMLSKNMSPRPTPAKALKDVWFSSGTTRAMRGFHARASAGITNSFLLGMGEEISPAAAALSQLQSTLGVRSAEGA